MNAILAFNWIKMGPSLTSELTYTILVFVKALMMIFFIFTFVSSIALGEELCCSDFFETEISQDQMVPTVEKEGSIQSFSCQDHHSESSHKDSHLCVGCSHSPIAGLYRGKTPNTGAELQLMFKTNSTLLYSIFLENPYMPPRA